MWNGNVPLHQWKQRRSYSREENAWLTEEERKERTLWLFEEESFVPAAMIKEDRAYSILTDHLGTPTGAYDAEGNEVWSRTLDMNGEVIEETGNVGMIPFLFQGQYYDRETGLAYNRFRYYSPQMGMYISQDPIRLNGGITNIYTYVDDTNVWIDTYGLKSCYSNEKSQKLAEDIIKKHGGKFEKETHYRMPNRRAARQAASEIAGNLGNNPKRIEKKDYKGGPKHWEKNNSKIGQQSMDESSGWRDDIPGHTKYGIGPHVNAWNKSKGIYDNLHLLY